MKRLILIFAFVSVCLSAAATQTTSKVDISPTRTCLFARRDTLSLFLDYYAPVPGSETTWNGHSKPTILFLFGGGFFSGRRDEDTYREYYLKLVENGYGVVAIDYRLGMKGVTVKSPVASFGVFYDAIHMAVEDLHSATAFIIENGSSMGIDPDNIVVAGSSAGAITALQGMWELNGLHNDRSGENFSYRGVISFAGGVISKKGRPSFPDNNCPVLLLQGKEDRIVKYGKVQFFNLGFFGSSIIHKALKKAGAVSQILRFNSIGHEIANQMTQTFHYQDHFLKHVVMDGEKYMIDASVTDPSIRKWNIGNSTSDLYKKTGTGK